MSGVWATQTRYAPQIPSDPDVAKETQSVPFSS